MVFSSALFLTLFFPTVLGVYFLAQERLRNYVLLFASLFFYSWGEPKTIFIMIGLIIASYFVALAIEKWPKYAKQFLILGISLNLGALLFYKYWMFLLFNINELTILFEFNNISIPKIALPIGISFYVFQILSYIIDVYRKKVSAQKDISLLATYVSLFPQLVAGPIVRYETVLEDLENRKTNLDNVYIGLRRFVIGLAKKVLIADQIAVIADLAFNNSVETLPTSIAWAGILAYSLQIFFDFSAYSDMAIGIGRIFNFRFLENFNYPYSALSIQDFWRRWHISLSTWFRDYLYIPLGGSRISFNRTLLNSFIVFALCGLWHGATWNFVFWGIYHGLGLVFEKLGLSKVIEIFPKIIRNIYVWLFVIIGWVFFRADDFSHAQNYLQVMFAGNKNYPLSSFVQALDVVSLSNILVFCLGFFLSYPLFSEKYTKFRFSKIDSIFIALLFITAFSFAISSTDSPFLYFRF